MARDMKVTGPTLASPPWCADFLSRDHLIPAPAKVDASQFRGLDAVKVVVGAAGALAAAVSVPVDALSGPIPSGTVIHFGTNKFAVLSADAEAGDVTIDTLAIPTALVDNDTGWYAGTLEKTVEGGTVVGRTIAERDANTGYGPADAADDEVFIVAFTNPDVDETPDIELVRPGTTIYENFLPGWANLASGVKDDVRAKYHCILGV